MLKGFFIVSYTTFAIYKTYGVYIYLCDILFEVYFSHT